jgi:hypothetical protein
VSNEQTIEILIEADFETHLRVGASPFSASHITFIPKGNAIAARRETKAGVIRGMLRENLSGA